eukprot:scaffold2318_cov73-Cyclotella_meneghiniana.AAC.1
MLDKNFPGHPLPLTLSHFIILSRLSSSDGLRARVRRRGDVVDVSTIRSMVSLIQGVGAASTLRRFEEPIMVVWRWFHRQRKMKKSTPALTWFGDSL